MRFDSYLTFCTAQALASANTESLDLKDNGDDLSRKLNVVAIVNGGSVAGGTSMATKLQTCDDDSTWEDLVTYPTKTLAQIQAGGYIVEPQPLPAGLKRYVRLAFTASGTFTGDGTILAGITPSLDKSL